MSANSNIAVQSAPEAPPSVHASPLRQTREALTALRIYIETALLELGVQPQAERNRVAELLQKSLDQHETLDGYSARRSYRRP